jgi:N6-adenosine-specific RNA methylase IME4
VTALAQYDAACAALAAAVKADEVMKVRLEAKAIEAVGRVAKNFDLELQATKLRLRAEARLGEMLDQGEAQGIIAGHGGNRGQDTAMASCPPATLKDIGIDNKLSARARKLGGIAERAREAMFQRMDDESRKRGRVAIDVVLDELRTRNRTTRRQLARELSDASAALSPTGRKFSVIYADPAWSRKAGIGNRAYENQYTTMSWADILAMPVAQRVLPDAWLFLWIPRAHLLALHSTEIETPLGRTTVKLPLAWAVAQAWGFDAYSTCFVWTKTDEAEPDDHGLGLIVWDQDEVLCLFKRGRGLPMPDGEEKVGSNHREAKGRHSEKPTYYRDMINRMTGGVQVLELFAREDDERVLPPNFYTWGNQSKNTAEAPLMVADDGSPTDPDTGEIHEPEAQRDDTVLPTAPAPSGDEPRTSAMSPCTQGDGAAGRAASPKPPQNSADEGPDIPGFLRRNPDNSISSERA